MRQTSELLSFAEARALVEAYAVKLPRGRVEECALIHCDGRVLAREVRADRDFPPFSRATRDGFAVRAADTAGIPTRLTVVGEIAAGSRTAITIAAGQAAEIMTGAPLPEGADAVVMVEYTEGEGDSVTVRRAVRSGDNFVPRGAEANAGAPLLSPGTRFNPAAIAVAASVGVTSAEVYQKPVVAILATGDELVEVGEHPGTSQIRNSNSYSIAAQVRRAGGEPLLLPIARDNEPSIRAAVAEASSADLLLLSGGVSMGKYDLVEQVLSSEGARFHMTGAKIQPGKPIVFGTFSRQGSGELPFFGLPGNPISTMVTFDLLVTPVLSALGGSTAAPLRFAHAELEEDLKVASGLTRFLPATLSGSISGSRVAVVPWHGSGDLTAIVRANCYLVVPPEATLLTRGSYVSILMKD
jgi:molybdopterin molybdotransferase